jgi:hypothetical protein
MSEVLNGPWRRRPPQHLFRYIALRTEDHLARLEQVLVGDALYACSPFDLSAAAAPPDMDPGSWYGSDPAGHGFSGPAQKRPQPKRGGSSPGTLQEALENLGVVCLSASPDNRTLWRHRGDRQRGACLRFDTTAWPDSRPNLLPVQYNPGRQRPGLHPGLDLEGIEPALPHLLVKNPACADETEWRWLVRDGARTHMKIDPRMIDGVVLGPLAPDGLRARVLEIVSNRQTRTALLGTRIDPDTMAIVVQSMPGEEPRRGSPRTG